MDPNANKVLDVLEEYRATSLPELMALTDVSDDEVEIIVKKLAQAGLVKVKNEGTPDSIITIKEQAVRRARRTGSI